MSKAHIFLKAEATSMRGSHRLADRVNQTSIKARLAPGIVYSLQWSTTIWQFVYSVYTVVQLGPNWVKQSAYPTFLMWHSIIMDTDLMQYLIVKYATFFTDSWFLTELGRAQPQLLYHNNYFRYENKLISRKTVDSIGSSWIKVKSLMIVIAKTVHPLLQQISEQTNQLVASIQRRRFCRFVFWCICENNWPDGTLEEKLISCVQFFHLTYNQYVAP